MNINFTGIHNPQIYIKKGKYDPTKAEAIWLKCNLSDDANGADLSELKRLTANIPEVAEYYKTFTKDNKFLIKTFVANRGFGIALNETQINLNEYPVFALCTLVCDITKKVLQTPERAGNKYLQAMNDVANLIGQAALDTVFKH